MPIKSRRPKKETYADYRALQWAAQDDNYDFHASRLKDGEATRLIYLQPKAILFYQDVWHCPNFTTAKSLARDLLLFSDLIFLKVETRWVWVQYEGDSHLLPGQLKDDRQRMRG